MCRLLKRLRLHQSFPKHHHTHKLHSLTAQGCIPGPISSTWYEFHGDLTAQVVSQEVWEDWDAAHLRLFLELLMVLCRYCAVCGTGSCGAAASRSLSTSSCTCNARWMPSGDAMHAMQGQRMGLVHII